MRPRASSLTSEIPIEFSDDAADEDLAGFEEAQDFVEDDEAPTIPPPASPGAKVLQLMPSEGDTDPDTVHALDDAFRGIPSPTSSSVQSSEDLDDGGDVVSQEIWSARLLAIPDEPSERVSLSELFSAPPYEPTTDVDDEQSGVHFEPTRAAVEPPTEPEQELEPESARETDQEPEFETDPEQVTANVSGPEPEFETEPDQPSQPEESPPWASASAPVEPPSESAAAPAPVFSGPPIVGGVALDSVRGFEDLPEETQILLASVATLTALAADEEVGSFGAALVTHGRVGIMPSIADVASATAMVGEVVFTRGSLSDGVALRVVALTDDTVVASWSAAELQTALADCPWVADELRLVADRYQAIAGAALGLLGERLDETLRGLVLSRMDVKVYAPGEIIVTEGKAVPGFHVVGGGKVELVEGETITGEAIPGDFLFAAEVLSAGKATQSARASKSGALILFATRGVAHEMLMSVPPLLEILAG